ncbi:unnamed protein product [Lota lota]
MKLISGFRGIAGRPIPRGPQLYTQKSAGALRQPELDADLVFRNKSTKDRLKGKLDDSEARVQLAEEHSRELQDKCCLLEDTAARLRKNATEVAKSMTQLEGLNRELQEKSRAAALHEEAQCKEASQEKERNAQLTTKVQELEAKADPETQERERLCITLREETSFALDKVKQLSQELQVEKQKTGRAESILRELADSLKKLTRERDDLAGEVLGLRRQLEDKDLNELVKKHKSAVSQDAQNLAQISDLQAQLGEALTEKQEVQEKMQALQSQLESKEQSTVEKSQVGRQKAKVRELETKLKFEKAQVKRLEGLVASQKETQGNVELTAERSHQQLAGLRRRAQGTAEITVPAWVPRCGAGGTQL